MMISSLFRAAKQKGVMSGMAKGKQDQHTCVKRGTDCWIWI